MINRCLEACVSHSWHVLQQTVDVIWLWANNAGPSCLFLRAELFSTCNTPYAVLSYTIQEGTAKKTAAEEPSSPKAAAVHVKKQSHRMSILCCTPVWYSTLISDIGTD